MEEATAGILRGPWLVCMEKLWWIICAVRQTLAIGVRNRSYNVLKLQVLTTGDLKQHQQEFRFQRQVVGSYSIMS
jgi:hypothetical protein